MLMVGSASKVAIWAGPWGETCHRAPEAARTQTLSLCSGAAVGAVGVPAPQQSHVLGLGLHRTQEGIPGTPGPHWLLEGAAANVALVTVGPPRDGVVS